MANYEIHFIGKKRVHFFIENDGSIEAYFNNEPFEPESDREKEDYKDILKRLQNGNTDID